MTPQESAWDFTGMEDELGVPEKTGARAFEQATAAEVPTVPQATAPSDTSKIAWDFSNLEPAPGEHKPPPTTIWGHAGQAGMRFLVGGAESLAESAIALGEITPGIKKGLRRRFPGADLRWREELEDLGILTEAGIIERLAEGTGDVAAFFLPVNVASKFMLAMNAPRLVAQFLPMGLGTYASMKARAVGEGREVTGHETAIALAQVLGGMFAGAAGEKSLLRILKNVRPELRQAIASHVSNAALGAAFEATPSILAGESWDKVAEKATEGTLGAIIGVYGANRFPGVGGMTRKARRASEDQILAELGQAAETAKPEPTSVEALAAAIEPAPEAPVPRVGPEEGFVPRSYFNSKTRAGMLREAALVNREAWPTWLSEYIDKKAIAAQGDPRITDPESGPGAVERIKSYSAQGLETKEVAAALIREGFLKTSPDEASRIIRATKAMLGVPSVKDQVAFSKWKAAYMGRVERFQARLLGVEPEAPEAAPAAAEAGVTGVTAAEPGNVPTPAEELRQRFIERGVMGEAVPARPEMGVEAERMLAAEKRASEIAARSKQASDYVLRVLRSPRLQELGAVTPDEIARTFGLPRGVAERIIGDTRLAGTTVFPLEAGRGRKAAGQAETRARLLRRGKQGYRAIYEPTGKGAVEPRPTELPSRVKTYPTRRAAEVAALAIERQRPGRVYRVEPRAERWAVLEERREPVSPSAAKRARERLARHERAIVRGQAPWTKAERAEVAKRRGLRRAGPIPPGEEEGTPLGARLATRPPMTEAERPVAPIPRRAIPQAPVIPAETPIARPVEVPGFPRQELRSALPEAPGVAIEAAPVPGVTQAKKAAPAKIPEERAPSPQLGAGARVEQPPVGPAAPGGKPSRPRAPLEGRVVGSYSSKAEAETAARAYDAESGDEPPAEVVSTGPKSWHVVGRETPKAAQKRLAATARVTPVIESAKRAREILPKLQARKVELEKTLRTRLSNDERSVAKAELGGVEREMEVARQLFEEEATKKAFAKKAAIVRPEPAAAKPEAPSAPPEEPVVLGRKSPEYLDSLQQEKIHKAKIAELRERWMQSKGREKKELARQMSGLRSIISDLQAERKKLRAASGEKAPKKAVGERIERMRKISDQVLNREGGTPERWNEELNKALEAEGFTRAEYEGRFMEDSTYEMLGRGVVTGRQLAIERWRAAGGKHADIGTMEEIDALLGGEGPGGSREKLFAPSGRKSLDEQVVEYLKKSAPDLAQFPESVDGVRWLAKNKPRYEPVLEAVERELAKPKREPTKAEIEKEKAEAALQEASDWFEKMSEKKFGPRLQDPWGVALLVSGAALAAWALRRGDSEDRAMAFAALPLLFWRRGSVKWGSGRKTLLTAEAEARRMQARITRELLAEGKKRADDAYAGTETMSKADAEELARRIVDFHLEMGTATTKIPRPGAFTRAVMPLGDIINTKFGPFGKWLWPKMFYTLRSADAREGGIRQELKQIRIPESRSLIHLQGKTAADILYPKERENALSMWEAIAGNWLHAHGELPQWKERAIPAPASKHVEVIIDYMKNQYFGEPPSNPDPAVRAAAKEIIALEDKYYPAIAKEAEDFGFQIVTDRNGKNVLVPFQPHYTYAGKYVPHIMQPEAMRRPRTSLTGEETAADAEHNAKAEKIVYWMTQHLLEKSLDKKTGEYKKTEADIAREFAYHEKNAQLPYYKFTLDAQEKLAGHIEKSRFIDTPFGIEIDPAVLIPKYIRPAILRFEYARQFGRTGALASQQINAATEAGFDGATLKKLFDVGMEQSPELIGNDYVNKVVREMTGFATLKLLGLSGLSQLNSIFPILRQTLVSLNPLEVANYKAFGDGLKMAIDKSLVDLGLTREQGKKVRAQLVAGTGGTLEGERINYVMQLGGFFPKVATYALHLFGTVPADRFLRSWASGAGRSYADVLGFQMENAIKARDLGKVRDLKWRIEDLALGKEGISGKPIDPVRDFARWESLSEAEREHYRGLVGWTLSYRTQQRTRAADLPPLATTNPYLKAIYRFSPFAIRQTRESARQISSELLGRGAKNPHSQVARGLRYLALFVPAGMSAWAINYVQNLIREPNEEKRRDKAMRDPVFAKLVGLLSAANFFPWAADWVRSMGREAGLAGRLTGPVYGQILDVSEYSIPALTRGNPAPLMQWSLKSVGVPLLSGPTGTPIGRILGVPSGREIVERGMLRNVPGIGKMLVPTPQGVTPYAEAWWRSKHPGVARFFGGRKPAPKRTIYKRAAGE